jgi:hypothetical protein
MARQSVESELVPFMHELGKVPDHIIAEKAGVSRAVTVSYRNKLGIAAYTGHRKGSKSPEILNQEQTERRSAAKLKKSFRGRRSLLEQYRDRLGVVPDAEIAKEAGVTAENVRTYRKRRNILAQWREGEEVQPQVPATVVTADSQKGVAFLLQLEQEGSTRAYVVVAGDIAAAAQKAVEGVSQRYPRAKLISLSRVGEIF